MELRDATVLVTGGAKRVGRAIVERLAKRGAHIIIHYGRSEEEAHKLVESIRKGGGRADPIGGDLADADCVESLLAELSQRFPPMDVLVNNASVFFPTPLEKLDAPTWDKVLAVNLRAPFLLARGLGLAMAKRGHGKIISIADTAVRRPYRGHVAYLVSKAALSALTEILALELAPHVQVNTVAPGTVLFSEQFSDKVREAIIRRTPAQRIGTPEDVAAAVEYLITGGDFITGAFLPVDGGAALAPPR